MKSSIILGLLGLFLTDSAFAREEFVLARVTGYWRAEGCGLIAGGTGERLRAGHCAVDPRKIPYGSKVVFPDAECIAVDTGPAVVSRASARFCGRTAAEKSALVIDRFFETRKEAVAWSNAHPQFMTLRIVYPERRSQPTMASSSPLRFSRSGRSIGLVEPANAYGDKLPAPQNKLSSGSGGLTAASKLNSIGR
jgi:hypothetical protein